MIGPIHRRKSRFQTSTKKYFLFGMGRSARSAAAQRGIARALVEEVANDWRRRTREERTDAREALASRFDFPERLEADED